MGKLKYLLLAPLLCFLSCNPSVEKSENGQEKYSKEILNDSTIRYKEFKENGAITYVYTRVNEALQGKAYGYDSIGQVIQYDYYEDDLLEGTSYIMENGVLVEEDVFLKGNVIYSKVDLISYSLKSEDYKTGIITFDSTVVANKETRIVSFRYYGTGSEDTDKVLNSGNLVYNDKKIGKMSNFISLEAENDTILFDDDLVLKINLHMHLFSKAEIVIGEFNDKFEFDSIPKPHKGVLLEGEEFIYKFKPYKYGSNIIRGVIHGYNGSDEGIDEKTIVTEKQAFVKSFYVLPPK